MTAPGTELQLSQQTLQMFADMANQLEEFDAGGADNILQQILGATTPAEYNKAFEGDRALPMAVTLRIDRVRYARSEYTAGLPIYLVVDGAEQGMGKPSQWTVGAASVVAALTRAAFLNQLPCTGKAVVSERETKGGYRPVNWLMSTVTDNSQPTLDDAAKGKE